MPTSLTDTIRQLLSEQETLDLSAITDTSDLYDAGLTSFASVQLMLALEQALGVEFPERMLNRRTFASIANIEASLTELLQQKAA